MGLVAEEVFSLPEEIAEMAEEEVRLYFHLILVEVGVGV